LSCKGFLADRELESIVPASPSQDLPEPSRIPRPVRHAQALWGVALLVGVLAYSLHSALGSDGEETAPSSTPVRIAAARTSSSSTPTSSSATAPRNPFLVFILCDGETVSGAIYSGLITQDSITLEATPDRNMIIAVLQGQPTILPPIARVFQSECFRRALESGEFI
jgi:hypothetical protein